MSSAEKQAQRQAILHIWNKGVKSAKELCILTKMSPSTIYFNIEKLKKNNKKQKTKNKKQNKTKQDVLHKGGNGPT